MIERAIRNTMAPPPRRDLRPDANQDRRRRPGHPDCAFNQDAFHVSLLNMHSGYPGREEAPYAIRTPAHQDASQNAAGASRKS